MIYDLIWGVDTDGYDLLEIDAYDPPKTGKGLLYGVGWPAHTIIRSRGGPIEEYRPDDKFPGLFFYLDDTNGEPKALLEFVSRFGLPHEPRSGQAPVDELQRLWTAVRRVLTHYDAEDLSTCDELYKTLVRSEGLIKVNRVNPKEPPLIYSPATLKALVWTQLGHFIRGDPNIARCLVCKTPMRRNRSSRKTCSDSCRSKLVRIRKETEL